MFLIFFLPTPPLRAGAGLGNQAALFVAQDTFSKFLGRVWGGSCVFRLAYTTPAQCRAVV